ELLLRRRTEEDRGAPRGGAAGRGTPLPVRRAGVPRRRGAADPAARAEVQPSWEVVAALRLPEGRSERGLPPHQDRPPRLGRRWLQLPRPVRELEGSAPGEGGL